MPKHEYILVGIDGSHDVLTSEGPIELEECQKAVEGLILSYDPELGDSIIAYRNQAGKMLPANRAFPSVRGRVLIGCKQGIDFNGLTREQQKHIAAELRRRVQEP